MRWEEVDSGEKHGRSTGTTTSGQLSERLDSAQQNVLQGFVGESVMARRKEALQRLGGAFGHSAVAQCDGVAVRLEWQTDFLDRLAPERLSQVGVQQQTEARVL